MKYIKKVSVSHLPENTGAIIDSMNSGDDPHTNAPSINAIKNYVDSGDNRAFKTAWQLESSNVTNTTTSLKKFGTSVSITTTGKPIIVVASVVGYVSAGNVTFYVGIDENWKQYASTSASSRERETGFAIFENIPAGTHTVELGFACNQSSRTATIPAYVSNSILAFEI